ncbi:MAG TPA: CDP-alcohol phosphatidyltransferase family protein [Candidatus Dormibacteraeota bacterium]|nr:CDP-alcohol phosphatidyltransferase family protein [Candidatus Dormibacteraeota bacterium]
MVGRLAVLSLGLLAASVPPTIAMRRYHGGIAAARFAAGSVLAILAQQSLVGMAATRRKARLSAVDAMTLSRGAAAALLLGVHASGVRCRTGFAGWLGWASLVYGSVVCDWLDGPIARRLGATSPLGALLDLEGDSWLTLVTASSAVTWGGLPRYCVAAPLARYALLILALRRVPYERVYADEPTWARPIGIGQMSLFTAALAPFGAARTQLVVRLAAPIVAASQLVGTVLTYRRSQRVV